MSQAVQICKNLQPLKLQTLPPIHSQQTPALLAEEGVDFFPLNFAFFAIEVEELKEGVVKVLSFLT